MNTSTDMQNVSKLLLDYLGQTEVANLIRKIKTEAKDYQDVNTLYTILPQALKSFDTYSIRHMLSKWNKLTPEEERKAIDNMFKEPCFEGTDNESVCLMQILLIASENGYTQFNLVLDVIERKSKLDYLGAIILANSLNDNQCLVALLSKYFTKEMFDKPIVAITIGIVNMREEVAKTLDQLFGTCFAPKPTPVVPAPAKPFELSENDQKVYELIIAQKLFVDGDTEENKKRFHAARQLFASIKDDDSTRVKMMAFLPLKF